MIITPRLMKIAEMIPNGSRIADVGTDHGFLPIYLLKKNLIDFAVCSDIKKGPLSNAEKNIKKYTEETIECRMAERKKLWVHYFYAQLL